jgi:AAA15 family ATPase/GTPase
MQNAITTLRIRNFKSIKDVTLNPRRVNLIIGEPNVGKSNVLEAMSLLGGMVYEQEPRFMAGMVRYEQAHQLFYDSLVADPIQVESNTSTCLIGSLEWRNTYRAVYMSAETSRLYAENYPNYLTFDLDSRNSFKRLQQEASSQRTAEYGTRDFNENGDVSNSGHQEFNNFSTGVAAATSVRPYMFAKYAHSSEYTAFTYLRPPHGTNLKGILQAYPALRQKAADLFKQDGYRLAMRSVSNELEAVKERDGIIYSVPYSSIADTLQRLIFYLAAIESNDDAVILFEEPEAHSYPVYVSQLGRRIAESRNNQFFVATHSPYLITEILETMLPDDEQAQDVAIFVAYYEDYQTKLRQLTDAQVRGIRADGLDVFYNMDRLVHPDA